MKSVIMLGAPGSGKGTQTSKLAKEFDLLQVSFGDIFREAIEEETEIGLIVKQLVNNGILVPDDIVIKILDEYLGKVAGKKGIIFDGYPRNINQAETLSKLLLDKYNTEVSYVVSLDIDEEDLVKRLSNRVYCPDCARVYHKLYNKPSVEWVCDDDGTDLLKRPDDVDEVIRKRFKTYRESVEVLKSYYTRVSNIYRVDASKSLELVFSDLQKKFTTWFA